MKRKLLQQVLHLPGLTPSAALSAGSVNGLVIDRVNVNSGAYLSGNIMLAVGAATGTPTTQSVSAKLQHGNASDGSDMADVSGATLAALTANSTNEAQDFDLVGLKRYIRVVVTVAFTGGTTPAIPVDCSVALGDSQIEPSL